jgi:hypothetical protein
VRRKTAAAVVLTAMLATATVLAVVLNQSAGAGPLAYPSSAGISWSWAPVKIGQTAAMTIVMPRAPRSPAVLLGVRPLHPEDADGLTLRYAATTGYGLVLLGQRGWNRPAWQEKPLAGFVIPAHVVGGVTVGASSTKPGFHFIRGFVVDYRVGGTRYSGPMQIGFGICVGMRTCANAPAEG